MLRRFYDNVGRPHAVRLTPFEEYMSLDGSETYPMNCYVRARFTGRCNCERFDRRRFDRERLTAAVAAAAQAHPIFAARLTSPRRNKWEWQFDAESASIPILWETDATPLAGRPFDLTCEPPLRIHVRELDSLDCGADTDLVFEFHHSASDGVGLYQFLEEMLRAYADSSATVCGAHSAQVAAFEERHRFVPTWRAWWSSLPSQCWGLDRARTFLFHRIQGAVAYPTRSSSVPRDASEPFPAILETTLDAASLPKLRTTAKEAGVAINDLLLAATFRAIVAWRDEGTRPFTDNRFLRIAVPTNLRTSRDELTTAANRVSMVFIDRRPEAIRRTPPHHLLAAIHREMAHIKRHQLGWAFLWGLSFFKRVFGGFQMMMRQRRCWSSCVLTNHGDPLRSSTLPHIDGNIALNDGERALVMTELSGAPPLRAETALGINAISYNEQLFLAIHYDRIAMNRTEAERLLTLYLHELQQNWNE